MKKQTYNTIGAIFLAFTGMLVFRYFGEPITQEGRIALLVVLIPGIIFTSISYLKEGKNE